MQNARVSRWQRFLLGFSAGLLAGLVASLLMVLFSMLLGAVSLPELLGSSITQLMSPTTFQALHEFFGANAKYDLFFIIVAGQCLIFALSGGLCNLLLSRRDDPALTETQDQDHLRWLVGLWLAGALWLLTGLLFLPLTGAGFFGANLAGGVVGTMLTLAVVGLFFGLFFVLVRNWLQLRHLQELGVVEREKVVEAGLTRRTVLVRGGVWIGVAALGVLAWRFISKGTTGSQTLSTTSLNHVRQSYQPKVKPAPPTYSSDFKQVPGLSPEITSNDQFYQVSKNLASDPVVNATTWNMTITGLLERPYVLNYAQLQALPMKPQYETLMCISNEVGGQYISNALWKGVPLADLLAKAGKIKPGASKVVLYAADDYSDSIHLTKALEPTTLVAVYMNGVALPSEHGYPARLLVPGIYGMKHVKWITKIEVVHTDYLGYWQERGWSDPAPVRMTSRIDTPTEVQQLKAGMSTSIAGVAFSGDKGISMVDVSLDAGETWQHTTLKKPFSDLTWVLWEMPWQPKAGNYTLVVRAIDLEGNVQNPTGASPVPNGASGYHSVMVTVA